jgi:DUF971 family protein
MSEVYPTAIERLDGARLSIAWSDGSTHVYTARELREACPCATCREKRSAPPLPPTQLLVLSPQEARPLDVAGMRPVGAYAYNIAFSDGHGTGLFSFTRLRELGKAV